MMTAFWKQGLVMPALVLAAAISPLLTIFAPLGMAPLFITVALAGLYDCWRKNLWSMLDRQMALPLLLLAFLGGVSTFWAIDKFQTFRTSLVLAGEFTGGLVLLVASTALPLPDKIRITRTLAISLALAISLILVEQLTPGFRHMFGVTGSAAMDDYSRLNLLSRGLTFMSILLVPVTYGLWRQALKIPALLMFVLGAIAIFTSHSLASKLAIPTAALVAVLFWWRPKLLGSVCAGITALVIFASFPLALQIPDSQTSYNNAQWLPPSGHHRLTIWSFAARNTAEKPFFGWALDASRVIPDADAEIFYTRKIGAEHVPIPEAQLPLHPHSAPIQIWLELGLVGVVLTAAIIAMAFRRFGTSRQPMASVSAAALTAGFVVSCVSYGIWQSWWQGSIWIVVSLLAAINAPEPGPDDV